jgi:nucleoside-diphosphate-sugar epimerase
MIAAGAAAMQTGMQSYLDAPAVLDKSTSDNRWWWITPDRWRLPVALTTILGAGGTISHELVKILSAKGTPIRLVGRNPKPVAGAEVVTADISDADQAIKAVSGSSTVHLLVGLKYDVNVWQQLWPRIMTNTIEACKRAQAKLMFFDNVYMYGKVDGPMTEETPWSPISKKGEIRARIATMLMNEVKAGNLTAMIARAADFYGPDTRNSALTTLVFDAFAKGSTASWLVNDHVPHSLTFTPDAALGVSLLVDHEPAWNQVWHLPTSSPAPTGKELIEMAARAMGVEPRYHVLKRPVLKVVGLFNPMVRELYEMLYQNDSPYWFDSTKFSREFGFAGTSYGDGIRIVANSCKKA